MSSIFRKLAFWRSTPDEASSIRSEGSNGSGKGMKEAADAACKRWSKSPAKPPEEPILQDNVGVPLQISIRVNPSREGMIKQRELELLKREEEALGLDLTRICNMLDNMQRKQKAQMALEDEKVAKIESENENFKAEKLRQMEGLVVQEDELRSDLSSYELETLPLKLSDGALAMDKVKEDKVRKEEEKAKLDEVDASKKILQQQYEREYTERTQKLEQLKEQVKQRRDEYEAEFKKYFQTKVNIEDQLARTLVLKKAVERGIETGRHSEEGDDEAGISVRPPPDGKLMNELDWETNMKVALRTMLGNEGAKELNSLDEIESVEGYKTTDTLVRKTFTSKIYTAYSLDGKRRAGRLHAQVFELKGKMGRMMKDHFVSDSFKILRFVNKSPFRNLAAIYDVYLINKKVIIIQEELLTNLEKMVHEEYPLSEDKIRKYSEGLGLAINYLHNIGVAHQNINAENIFRDMYGIIKLAALEYATIFYDVRRDKVIMQKRKKKKPEGTYRAPEMSVGIDYNPAAADVFSYGIMIIFMANGEYPYDCRRNIPGDQQWDKARQDLVDRVGESAMNLLRSCLQLLPEDRITMREAVVHPWFTDRL